MSKNRPNADEIALGGTGAVTTGFAIRNARRYLKNKPKIAQRTATLERLHARALDEALHGPFKPGKVAAEFTARTAKQVIPERMFIPEAANTTEAALRRYLDVPRLLRKTSKGGLIDTLGYTKYLGSDPKIGLQKANEITAGIKELAASKDPELMSIFTNPDKKAAVAALKAYVTKNAFNPKASTESVDNARKIQSALALHGQLLGNRAQFATAPLYKPKYKSIVQGLIGSGLMAAGAMAYRHRQKNKGNN
jgi:hypothetical protein